MRSLVGWRVVCCFTLEWVALAVWVGGLLVLIGVVIPAVFNTWGGQHSGGLFLTKTFEGYNCLVVAAMGVMGAGFFYRWWSGNPAATVGHGEAILLVGMAAIAGVIIVFLHPQAAELQAQAFAVQGEAERKAAFEALFSVLLPLRVLYMVNLLLGILLIGVKVKRSLYRDEGLA